MTLEKILQTIKQFCEDNEVILFEGFADDNSNKVLWTNQDGFTEFLEFGTKIEPEVVSVFSTSFNLYKEIDYDEIASGNDLNNKKEIKEMYNWLKRRNGQISSVVIGFIREGIIYEFHKMNYEIDEKVEELKNLLLESTARKIESLRSKLNEKEIGELAKKLAAQEEYFKFHTRPNEIEKVLKKVLQESGLKPEDIGWSDSWGIKEKAKSVFEEEFLEEREKELIEKIRRLKGRQVTKIEMISRLGITKGMLDKYYFKA